jgi:hypothetical protein
MASKLSIYDIVVARLSAEKATKAIRSKIQHRRNIAFLREQTKSRIYPSGCGYQPKVSERYLEAWLDFPRTQDHWVLFNTFMLVYRWLLWTNKSLASLGCSVFSSSK